MSKPRLILLSDIFGQSTDPWMDEYRNLLTPHFELVEYDSRDLAEIQTHDQNQVHDAFVNGGIDRAVQNLCSIEPNVSVVLGFSVGGTIAWKFALKNNAVRSIHAISATRLRNEAQQPSSRIHLYFGELETNGPVQSWFETLNLTPTIFENQSHECYRMAASAKFICKKILS